MGRYKRYGVQSCPPDCRCGKHNGNQKCKPGCKCGRHAFTVAYPQRPQRHGRVAKTRGRVTDYECVACQEINAENWAQVHGADPMDIYGYQPMCRRCHFRYDNEQHPKVNGRWVAKSDM
jgi:hypothetical protein